MSRTAEAPQPLIETASFQESYLQAYRWMLLARILEEKIASLYKAGKITGGVFLGKGQEALSASLGMQLRKGDVYAPLIRDQAGRLAFGEPILDCTRTYMGVRSGPMRGRDGNVHRGRPSQGILPMISHLCAMISVINGTLMARRFRGETGAVGGVSIGEGATSTGAFHEALNQAAVEQLPLVLVVANNQYAYSTPNSRQFACADLVDKAIGYGVHGSSVDGTDLGECLRVVGAAIERAREGGGPQLVVASLLRLVGHGEHDDAHYIDPSLKKAPLGRDCLRVAEAAIRENAWASPSTLEEWSDRASLEVDEAVAMTLREALPNPSEEIWCALSARHLSDGFTDE